MSKEFLARGSVSAYNGKTKMRELQVKLLADEVRDELEHIEPYGFTAEPHADGIPEAFTLFFDGERSHGVVISVADRRFRFKELAPGEVAIYDDLDQRIHLTRENIHIFTPQNFQVTVGQNSKVDVSGSATVNVSGSATVNVDGTTTLTCPTVNVNAFGSMTFDTPTLTVTGQIVGLGGMAISGGTGATVDGSMSTTGDVTAGGVSLMSHTHGGTEPGQGSTGTPN